jgi:hypothetical protein
MKESTIKTIARIAKKAEYPGIIHAGNVSEIIKSLAENHAEILAESLHRLNELSADYWEMANNKQINYDYGIRRSSHYSDKLEEICQVLGIIVNWTGLYATYTVRGRSEYTPLNALREYNHAYIES